MIVGSPLYFTLLFFIFLFIILVLYFASLVQISIKFLEPVTHWIWVSVQYSYLIWHLMELLYPPYIQVYWDESSKQVYYGKTLTSETTWNRPTT